MIHCPYCGAQLDETAKSCSSCRSLLIGSDQREHRQKPFPKPLHPVTAAVAILVVSAGLLAASIFNKTRSQPETDLASGQSGETRQGAGQEAGGETGAIPGSTGERSGEPQDSPLNRPGPVRDQQKNDEYQEMIEYEDKIRAVLGRVDTLTKELDRLFGKNDKKELAVISGKLRELQDQTRKMRSIRPPRTLQRTHNRLANSFAMSLRGYRGLVRYVQSGQMDRLDQGRNDLESAKNIRREVLVELEETIEKLAPPPPPAETTEPGPSEIEVPESRPPLETEVPEVQPEEGDTFYPEEGDTVYIDRGDTVYDEEDYMEEGDTTSYEEADEYEELPEAGQETPGFEPPY